MKIGRGRSSLAGLSGMEQLGVDAARPHAEMLEAALGKLLPQRGRRHHRHGGGVVEVAQHRVAEDSGIGGAHRDVFGKARRVAGGEGKPVAAAIGARRPADRPFGRDVDGVRRRRLDPPRDLAPARQRDAQARIGRQRPTRESRPA